MASVKDLLEMSELKRENLGVQFDKAHAQASSFLLLSLQWKELDDMFEMAKNSLLKQAEELDFKEKLQEKTAQVLQQRHEEVEKRLVVLDKQETKLCSVDKQIGECNAELSSKEKQLNLVRKEIEKCSQELEMKGKEVEKVKVQAAGCNNELVLKKEELSMIKNSISDCNDELELKRKQLEVLKELGKRCSAEVDMKARELYGIDESIEQHVKELDLKMVELNRVQQLIGESSKDLDSIKVLIGENTEELEAKQKQQTAISKCISEMSGELKSKEAELELVEKSIAECLSELQAKEKKLDSVQKYSKQYVKELEMELNSIKGTMKTYCDDLKLKEREFNVIMESIVERDKEFKMKEEQLKSVQVSITNCNEELAAMKKQQNLVQKLLVESSEELELKSKNLDVAGQKLKEHCDNLVLKQAELDSMRELTSKLHKDIEEKEKYFGSLERTLAGCSKEIEMKATQFEERVKEFELEKQQFESVKQSVEECWKQVELKERQLNENVHPQEMVVKPENFMNNHCLFSEGFRSCISSDGKILQLLLNEHFRIHDLVHSKVLTAIEKSPDPGKLVLDAIQGFYPPGLNAAGILLDLSVIRRSCTTLLEQLLKISPRIKRDLRKEAMKLACEWKAKMGALNEDSVEVLGFLHLVAAFNLGSAFSPNELKSLISTVSKHRQALVLQHALEIAENLPGSNVSSSQVKIERIEDVHTTSDFLSENVMSGENLYDHSGPLVLNDYMMGYDLNEREVLQTLMLLQDSAEFVLKMMQGLCSQHMNEGAGLDTSFMDRSKVLILEQLMKVSPKISPRVKEDARKLANFWKENAAFDFQNKMDVWAFLLFVTIYELICSFKSDEMLLLIETVAHEKEAPEICRKLGLAAMVPRLIPKLLYKQQYIDAIRFSCVFEQLHFFPLESVLLKYMENLKKDASSSKNGEHCLQMQDEAIDKELVALKAILECITEYKLESKLARLNIPGRIIEVENRKASNKGSSAISALTAQPQVLRGGNHQVADISGLKYPPSAPRIQLSPKNKRSRMEYTKIHK